MFTEVENALSEYVQRVKFEGEPIQVYPYIPDQDKDETKMPCYAFARQYWKVNAKKAHDSEIFIPSEETITQLVPPNPGLGDPVEVTGPASWTVKPFPTPIDICYEFRTRATNSQHRDQLALKAIQLFHGAICLHVGDQRPLVMLGEPHNLDQRAKPLFEMSTLLWVYEVWVERLESYTVPSILIPTLEQEIQDN